MHRRHLTGFVGRDDSSLGQTDRASDFCCLSMLPNEFANACCSGYPYTRLDTICPCRFVALGILFHDEFINSIAIQSEPTGKCAATCGAITRRVICGRANPYPTQSYIYIYMYNIIQ